MSNTTESATTAPKAEEALHAAATQKATDAMVKKIAAVIENCEQKYPHAMVGKNAKAANVACTLRWDGVKNKFQCQIKCTVTGQIGRWVYTSDLFQVTMCEAEATKAKTLKKAAKKVTLAQAMEIIKAAEAAKAGPVKPTETVSTPETQPETEEVEADEKE